MMGKKQTPKLKTLSSCDTEEGAKVTKKLPETTKEKINSIEKRVCENGIEESNLLGDLVQIYLLAKNEESKLIALHALRRTFTHIIERGDFVLLEGLRKNDAENQENDEMNAMKTYVTWLEERYKSFLQETMTLVNSVQKLMQVAALRTVMHFVGKDPRQINAVEIFHGLLCQIIVGDNIGGPNGQVFRVLKTEFIQPYLDIRYMTFDGIEKFAKYKFECLEKQCVSNKKRFEEELDGGDDDDDDGDSDDDDHDENENEIDDGDSNGKQQETKENDTRSLNFNGAWNDILEELNPELFSRQLYELLLCIESREIKSEETRDKDMYWRQNLKGKNLLKQDKSRKNEGMKRIGPTEHKKRFQSAWIAFAQLPLSKYVYRRVLSIIADRIIPYLASPLLMADFLTESYSIGCITSLLSLNGIWILMSEHGLDYPEFYGQLYKLLEPELFYAKHKARFFELLDLFMTSSHISSHLVAAFAKKLARLALRAPPSGCMYVIVFIHNLLKRHPACLVLVHRGSEIVPEIDRKNKVAKIREMSKLLAMGKSVETNKSQAGANDPFLFDELDPYKSRAMDSSLWEIETLSNHYSASVSSLVNGLFHEELRVMLTTKKIEPPIPIADFTGITYSTLFEQELKRKQKKSRSDLDEFDVGKIPGKRKRKPHGGSYPALALKQNKDEGSAERWSCLRF